MVPPPAISHGRPAAASRPAALMRLGSPLRTCGSPTRRPSTPEAPFVSFGGLVYPPPRTVAYATLNTSRFGGAVRGSIVQLTAVSPLEGAIKFLQRDIFARQLFHTFLLRCLAILNLFHILPPPLSLWIGVLSTGRKSSVHSP